MKKKLSVLLSVLCVLWVSVALFSCGKAESKNKFSAKVVQRIQLGDTQERVRYILGAPDLDVDGYWKYYDDNYK